MPARQIHHHAPQS